MGYIDAKISKTVEHLVPKLVEEAMKKTKKQVFDKIKHMEDEIVKGAHKIFEEELEKKLKELKLI